MKQTKLVPCHRTPKWPLSPVADGGAEATGEVVALIGEMEIITGEDIQTQVETPTPTIPTLIIISEVPEMAALTLLGETTKEPSTQTYLLVSMACARLTGPLERLQFIVESQDHARGRISLKNRDLAGLTRLNPHLLLDHLK